MNNNNNFFKRMNDLYIIYSAVQILYEIIKSYHARDIHVYIVKVQPYAFPLLDRGNLLRLIGPRQLYNEVADAIQAVEYDISST